MHNKRKHHNKYTQKHIHNNTARAYKRKLRHTRHNPRHNITHKQRGGFVEGLFDKAKKYVDQTSTFFNKDENTKELIKNAEAYDTTRDLGVGAQNRSDIVKGLGKASLLTTIAKVAVVGLSASGVGLPLAGVIATALIIAHVFAEMNISNLNLKSVMYDTLNIISNSYILNDYIEYVEKHMKIKNNNSQENASTEKHNQIISGLKERLKDKLKGLINYLLSIATDDMLTSLKNDKSATQAIRELVDSENAKRKGFRSFMARAGRVVDRTLKADRTISYIIRDLSIINGYFMLVKSHFDLSLDAFERSLETDNVKAFWAEVENGSDDTKPVEQHDNNNDQNNLDKAKNPYMRYLYGGLNDAKLANEAESANAINLESNNENTNDDENNNNNEAFNANKT